MRYQVVKEGEQYCVQKEDGTSVKDGCHPMKADADAMMKDMMASEGKAVARKQMLLPQSEVQYTSVSTQVGKACAGCRWFETYGSEYSQQDSCHLVEGYPLVIEPTGYCDRYEAVPAPMPDPMMPMPVMIVDPPEMDMAGAAEAREKALAQTARRLWEGLQKHLGMKADEPLATGFKVEGNHWLAVWSNNFKDRDGELFTAAAMEDYVARVDMGTVPLPELWVWHIGKQVAIGSADWVSTHDHFLMAAGQFYGSNGAKTAKAYYAKHAPDTGISHGYTYPESTFDGKAYHQFNTFEISLLPRGAEANWFTSLEGVKAMALSEDKQKYLEAVFGKEHAARMLADWEKRGKALETIGVEFKDFVTPEGETTSTSAKAVEAADKSLKDLFPELVEGSAEAVTVALEAARRVKALEADNVTLRGEIDALRTDMQLRPRSASRATETELDGKDGKGKELLDTVHEQMVERDGFWGTEVVKTP